LGEVLSFRMGMRDRKDFPDFLAATAAQLDAESGRRSRSLSDTAVFAPYLYNAQDFGESARRGVDFYREGTLLWLEADTIVRDVTGGRKSLDDFCRAFVGVRTTAPTVVPYTRADVVAALRRVAPYDWAGFLHDRLDVATAQSPNGGFTRSGYRLAYDDRPSKWIKYGEARGKNVNLIYSLGMTVLDDGQVTDVADGSPAARAGIGYGMKIVAMGGRMFNRDSADAALRAAMHERTPMQVITDDQGVYAIRAVDYHGGPRYPHLIRSGSQPDWLRSIAAPHRADRRS
ncbi:MAG: M61 family peptidase, partial [Candidatus Velthaea sp.]